MSSTAGSLESRLALNISDWVASAQKAGSVTQTEFDRMQRIVKQVNAQVAELNRMGKEAANSPKALTQAAADAEKAASGLEHVGFASAGAKRELLVLAHEASQGNWSRFGGSLMVVAERANLMELAFTASGAAIGGVTAVVAGFFALLVKGAIDQQRFNDELQRTGNFAGMTKQRFDDMASALAMVGNTTVGKAGDALNAAIGTGVFGPDQVAQVAQAIVETQRVTSESADDIVKDFARMQDGVAKWAEEHNRSLHFISAADYELIRDLEEQGKSAEAQSLVLDRYNEHLAQSAGQLGMLSKAWLDLRQGTSQYFKDIEELPQKIDGTIDAAKAFFARIASLQSAAQAGVMPAGTGLAAGTSAEDAARAAETQARAKAAEAKRQQEAMAASDFVRQFQAEASAANKAATEIDKYRVAVEKMRAAHDPKAPTQAQEDAFIKQYQARHHGPTNRAGQSFIESLQREVETAGLARSALLEMEAAQKGVSAAAAPYIERLKEMEQRARDVKLVLADIAQEQVNRDAMASVVTGGNDYVATIDMQTSAIGKSADELERLNAQHRLEGQLQAALARGVDAKTATELYAEYAKNMENVNDALDRRKQAQDAYNANPMNGVDKALTDYYASLQNQAKSAEDLVTGGLSRMEDAFVQFAKTGKLSMGDLFSYIEEQFLRMEISKMLMSMMGGGDSNAGIGTMLFDAISGGGMQSTHLANGIGYVPYDGYMATLHEGERVLTKQENAAASSRSSAGGTQIHVGQGAVYNIGQGVSRAEVVAGIQQSNAAMEQRFKRLMRQERLQ